MRTQASKISRKNMNLHRESTFMKKNNFLMLLAFLAFFFLLSIKYNDMTLTTVMTLKLEATWNSSHELHVNVPL